MVGAQDSRCLESEGEARGDDERSVTELGDVALVVAVARHNRDALAEMYRRYGPKGYGLARRLCGEDRAKDVVQQVFLEIWEKPDRYDPDRGSLRTFLLAQVYGRSIDRLRHDGLRAEETPTAGIEAAVPTRSSSDKVWQLLSALPDGERDAIVLAHVNGCTYRDVADLLGEPEGTVKSRIRAGLVGLRLALSDEGPQSAASLA